MAKNHTTVHHRSARQSIIAEHEVLRNTYCLLGISLMICAATATASVLLRLPHPGLLITLVGFYGLLFAIQANSDNGTGLILTFAFTGFMGYTLGPILSLVLYGFANGTQILISTTACTGTIFMVLSAYVLTTRENFTYMGGMLMILILTGILMSLGGLIFQMPLMVMMSSALFVLVFSGMILFHTSNIIHGGERNYILATISLFLAIYNLFVNLLQIMMMLNGRRD
jgi:modulator of FtsH protease